MRRELGGWPIRDDVQLDIATKQTKCPKKDRPQLDITPELVKFFQKPIDKNTKKAYYKHMNNYSYVQK